MMKSNGALVASLAAPTAAYDNNNAKNDSILRHLMTPTTTSAAQALLGFPQVLGSLSGVPQQQHQPPPCSLDALIRAPSLSTNNRPPLLTNEELLHRHFLQLQEQQQAKSHQDIIGMGICVPGPLTSATGLPGSLPLPTSATSINAAATSYTAFTFPVSGPLMTPKMPLLPRKTTITMKTVPHKKKTVTKSHQKMMAIGKPLMAPPSLPKKILTKRAVVAQPPAAPSTTLEMTPSGASVTKKVTPLPSPKPAIAHKVKRSLLKATPEASQAANQQLSIDELAFVEAAQRLREMSMAKSASPAALQARALKPPPALFC